MALSGKQHWPDFLLIGAPKAGTTALFKALSRHSDIHVSPEKEPRYFAYPGARPDFNGPSAKRFSSTIVSDEVDYRELFKGCPRGKLAGEASTAYLHSEVAPGNAASCIPNARIIVVLRHPVDRAYSQWLHLVQEGLEKESDFETAWGLESERAAKHWPPVWQYRDRGFYGKQLQRWFSHFPRGQFLVLFYEDWLQRPDETLGRICRHLEIDDALLPKVTRENVSSRQPRWKWLHHRMVGDSTQRRWAQQFLSEPVRDLVTSVVTGLNLREGPRLDGNLRSGLFADYLEDILLLEELTGANLSLWKDSEK